MAAAKSTPVRQEEVRESPPPELRATRTRPALFRALLSLLEEKPFEHLTVRDITARAEIGYRTFFRRYPDKEALLHELAAEEIAQLLAMTLPILHTVDSRASTKALAAYVWEHRPIWASLLTGGAAPVLKEEFVRQARRLAKVKKTANNWLPGDLRVVFAVSAVIEVLAWWLEQAKPISIDKMAEVLDRLVVAPVIDRT